MRKSLFSLLLIIIVGWLAFMLSRTPRPAGRANLVNISVSDFEVEPDVLTPSTDEVERYIVERFGVRVRVPEITGASIAGVGSRRIGDGVEIPILIIDDPQGDVSRIFAFTYSLLDDWARTVFLDRAVRVELEQSNQYAVISTESSREAVLWRSGDDIFLAVAERGAGNLVRRMPDRPR